jgi:hypothetical protein
MLAISVQKPPLDMLLQNRATDCVLDVGCSIRRCNCSLNSTLAPFSVRVRRDALG